MYCLQMSFYKCDYYNQGHLEKVDQSDYKKITIQSTPDNSNPR